MRKAFLPGGWHTAHELDGWLSQHLREVEGGIEIHFAQDSKLSIGACIRFLSFLEELHARGTSVALCDLSTWGVGAYFERIGLMELLPPGIKLMRAEASTSRLSPRGALPTLEEIVRLPFGQKPDADLPNRLATKLASGSIEHRDSLKQSAFTFFSELVGNVRTHSGTPRSGMAALQIYTPPKGLGRLVEVTVSDAGSGVLGTLRPSVAKHYPKLTQLNDEELLCQVVNHGLSRNGVAAGCGIPQSAKKLLRWRRPVLDLRLQHLRLELTPDDEGVYAVTRRNVAASLFPLPGTQWVARYQLD